MCDRRLFLHTKLSNPHYPPGVQAETTLINFTVTEKGLEDQLLALVVNKERPELERKKTELIVDITNFTIKLKELEEDLLYKLSTAEGDLTENVPLIESLEESKRVSDDVNVRVADARKTEITINEARERFRPVATRGSMLFFLLNSLNKIHAFYQFSLNAFVTVFLRGIDLAPYGKKQVQAVKSGKGLSMFKAAARKAVGKPSNWNVDILNSLKPSLVDAFRKRTSTEGGEEGEGEEERAKTPGMEENLEELEKRLQSLIETITFTVFNFTRRGLFDRDKLIVSSMLAFNVLLRSNEMEHELFDALCMGLRSTKVPNITDELSRWMTDSQWAGVDALTKLGPYAHLAKDMEKNSDAWQRWAAIEQCENSAMPGEWGKMVHYKQLLIIRALRPDRLTGALTKFVSSVLGDK